ncbi:unnamed protein product [Aphanomyces euteiches]
MPVNTRASRRVNKIASASLIITCLRSIQSLATLMTMIFMLISFSDILLKDDGKSYRFAQLPHFFTVMVGILGFAYSLMYCILVLGLDYWSQDVLLERIADCVFTILFAALGFLVGKNASCDAPPALNLNCSNVCGTVACLYLSAAVYLAAFVFSMLTEELPNPDSAENLVPRGHYGPSPASPAVPSAFDVSQEPLNDNTTELKPRGKFGSIQDKSRLHSIPRDNSGGLV